MNNMKDLFDKKFNKQNNYNLIINKLNRKKHYKCILAIVPLFIFVIFLYNNFNNTNKLENDPKKESIIKFKDIININSILDTTNVLEIIYDIAARKIEVEFNDIINKYPILNKLKTIEGFNLTNAYELYDEVNPEKENYNLIRGYYLSYETKENASMSIYISTIKEMRDRCIKINNYNLEESIINNTKVKLVKYSEGYVGLLKIENLYFDIEAYNLEEQEFLDIIHAIVR